MEQTLNTGLNGEEIRIAVLDKVGLTLQRDCYLSKNFTYRGVKVNVVVEIQLEDVGGDKEVKREIIHSVGEVGPDAELIRAETGIENEPPNQTRIETGQPVPVLSKDASGKVTEKSVQYARPKPASGRAGAAAR